MDASKLTLEVGLNAKDIIPKVDKAIEILAEIKVLTQKSISNCTVS